MKAEASEAPLAGFDFLPHFGPPPPVSLLGSFKIQIFKLITTRVQYREFIICKFHVETISYLLTYLCFVFMKFVSTKLYPKTIVVIKFSAPRTKKTQ